MTNKINILAAQNSLRVTNPVSNIDEQQRSGIGLQIVTRICQKNRWILDIQENEESFNVTIHFNTAD